MPDTTPCPQCARPNDPGAAFCSSCGASTLPSAQCPSCNRLNPIGNKFCSGCGGSLEHAGWAGQASAGGVVDGVWERSGDDLIRRVDPEDARRYLGTRTVRVPAGTVGVVLVDGVVERIMPPGERTTLGVFERIANFFLNRERTAFYLVDQRTFPIPFVVQTRASAEGELTKSQVLVTFTLPRGDRAALGNFIANVLGPRPAFSTGELYNLLRPEVVGVAQRVIERASIPGPISYPDVEAAIRTALATEVGPRYGLTIDATLAPLTRIASLTFRIGTGAAPQVRACTSCRRELPVSLRFCDGCGAKQPEFLVGGGAPSAESPLFTSDGQQLELEVVIRVQGQHDGLDADAVAPALVGAVAAYLGNTTLAALTAPGGLTALEHAITPGTTATLAGLGLTIAALAIVDVRTKLGDWKLAAQADLLRARDDVALGMAWLDQRDAELDLEQLTLTRILRHQRQERDQKFVRDEAATADRERRDGLAARESAIDVAAAERSGATRGVVDSIEQARQKREVAHASELRQARVQAELDELSARRDLDFADQERRKRLELELSALAEAQQLDKLRGMAAIERDAEAQAHAQELEKRRMLQGLSPEAMVALQAAELAKTEGGGAAWANVLAQRANADSERRHAEDTRGLLERQQASAAAMAEKAMAAMAAVATSRAEAAPVIAGGGSPVVTVATGAGRVGAARACKACGALMNAGAQFCGGCGATQA